MIKFSVTIVILAGLALSLSAEESSKKVKYKSQGRIDFESLLIEGERKKPEMAVVTGNIGEKDSGLLKFREDFLDVMAQDFGESVE
jgi:hypothetical protein